MEPNAAQGFSMIIEDIGVLDFLLQRDRDPNTNMPAITATWQQIRKPRCERIKAYAKENTAVFLNQPLTHRQRQESTQSSVKSLKDVMPDMDARFTSSRFIDWALD
ncbi:hypothetical protein DOTSEDRAFT_42508 [Dothistroma septosporum NZE10]|uniref:Uncharacterized protein n=1 Tax=Dothistroma septosporum (strain NZE10 / CBS 128990) TaxID=675120 RepID=N1PXX0_DOTSN|nr:hypothetical protein DOTSEDRAFT_42508 [Dothistroma septosporum NZE10]